jgi:nucleotide-binding universal stress UspA family protein
MDATVILVPLDSSEFSEVALGYAETVARATQHTIHVLHVVETEIEGLLSPHLHLNATLEQARTDTARQYLQQVVARLTQPSLTVEMETRVGSPAREILSAAERDDVAMVVMATHGRGGVERWAIGSVADKALRLGGKPTLLVRPSPTGQPVGARALRRLAVPLDGSPSAAAALEPAKQLALATGAELVLLRVIPDLTTVLDWGTRYVPELGEWETAMSVDAKQALETVRSQLGGSVRAEVIVLVGSAAYAIAEYVKGEGIDLTVMTTHGRGGLRRVLLGNTASRLVQSGAAVLIIHPPAAEAGGT